jgi:hypothetical protein
VKNNNKKRFICILAMPLIWSAVFIFPNLCFAEIFDYKNLVVTELMYDPKGADTNQTDWIEVHNPTLTPITIKKETFGIIDEEKLEPASDKIHYLNCHKIESDIDIQPKDYIVLADNKEKFASSYSGTKNVFDSTFSLSSEGDFIKLSNDRCATFFIELSYENSWGGKDNGKTMEKINFDHKYLKEDWQESCINGGTPGKENSEKSDCHTLEEKNSSAVEIKKDDEIYKNIYADFEVNYPGATDETKYTWNFGDGHKSYLQKARHKYKETGIYQASITVRGDKKDFQNFTVEVEDYSAPKIKIIRVIPNPRGNDSKEYIVLENKSKNKINLKDWSIATGWKSLVNHPIRDDFIIKPGKSKKLTKKISAFTLNNSQGKIELRYPNGETAQKLKYNRKKDKIEDDEVFEMKGKNWNWNKPQNNMEDTQTDADNQNNGNLLLPLREDHLQTSQGGQRPDEGEVTNLEESKPHEDIQIDKSELEANLGKYSENPDFAAKKQNRIQLISYATSINAPISLLDTPNTPGKVAGAYTEKINIPEKSWSERLVDWLWIKVNSNINFVLNKL